MPRKPSFPSYPRKPHASGRARITLAGRAVYLGPFGGPESWSEYERLLAEWRAAQVQAATPVAPPTADGPVRTVGDLIARFWVHAQGHYRTPGGQPSTELAEYRKTLQPLRKLYSRLPIRDFGPVALQTVLRAMADGSWLDPKAKAERERQGFKTRLCRGVANRRISRIKRVWKWAASQQLIPYVLYDALRTLPGLPAGRGLAVEHAEIPPVPEEDLAATLPYLSPSALALVRFQLLTSCRPGEAVALRPCDLVKTERVEIARGVVLNTGGKVWVYRPETHKSAHRGHQRVILVGPQAQALLAPLLVGLGPEDHVFSPARDQSARLAAMRQARKSKVPPSQRSRKKPRPERRPKDHWKVSAYDHHVRRACLLATATATVLEALKKTGPAGLAPADVTLADVPGVPGTKALLTRLVRRGLAEQLGKRNDPDVRWRITPAGLAADLRPAECWHPHQLRHNAATRLVEQFGWETARIVLGHKSLAATRIYALDNLRQAAEAVAQVG